MEEFELKLLDCIADMENMKKRFCKLIQNGTCWYDDFCKEIEKGGNLKGDLKKIQVQILLMAEGIRSPKCKALKGRKNKDPHPDYEIKVGRLRVFLFEDSENGNIIVMGQIKKDKKRQSKMIEQMREIKLAYFQAKEQSPSLEEEE